MSSVASEADIEKMIVDVCAANGWKYLQAAGIGRPERSVLLEGQLREALSPDECLIPWREEFKWLSRVYETLRPVDDRGQLIWAALGPKTLELVHENVYVTGAPETGDSIALEAELSESLISTKVGKQKT